MVFFLKKKKNYNRTFLIEPFQIKLEYTYVFLSYQI